MQTLPLTINGLIPHGPSIRMVDQLINLGERRASTSFTVQSDSPWVDEHGELDELAYMEIVAQSFAATHCFHLSAEQLAVHKGLLLGVSNLVITTQARAGEELTIEIRKITRFGDFGIVEGEVRHEDGRLIATCQVKVWRSSDAMAPTKSET